MTEITLHYRYRIQTRDRKPNSRLQDTWFNGSMQVPLREIDPSDAPLCALVSQTRQVEYIYDRPDFTPLPDGSKRAVRTVGDQHFLEWGTPERLRYAALTEVEGYRQFRQVPHHQCWLKTANDLAHFQSRAHLYRETIDHREQIEEEILNGFSNYVIIEGSVYEAIPEPILTTSSQYNNTHIMFGVYSEDTPFVSSQAGIEVAAMGDRITELDRLVEAAQRTHSDVEVLAELDIIDPSKFKTSPVTRSARQELDQLLASALRDASGLPADLGYAVMRLRDVAAEASSYYGEMAFVDHEVAFALDVVAQTPLPDAEDITQAIHVDPLRGNLVHWVRSADEMALVLTKSWERIKSRAAEISAAAKLDLPTDSYDTEFTNTEQVDHVL